jgi:acetylornithine deacetylase/succinyl-diaminopimelate desuccinylase-like protein
MDSLFIDRILDLAIEIQQTPAPTFAEGRRAALILERFQTEGLADATIDEIGNVYARLPGAEAGRPVVVSAHLDTVFPASTELKVKRSSDRIAGPGIGDNALGVAGLFGVLWILRQLRRNLARDLWLVANVGEEGLGDLRGMQAVVRRFKDQSPDFVILEGMALGQIYHRGLGVRRYRIMARTPGGHSWVDYGQPSAVHELAILANRILALALPVQPRTTLNIGKISGGISINTIAAEAHLELDLRSEDVQSLATLATRVETLVQQANRSGVEVTGELIGQRPVGALPRHHPLVRLAVNSLEAVGVSPCLNIGSTDANVPLSEGLPAVCLGLTTGNGAHTQNEYINTRPLAQGLRQVIGVLEGLSMERNGRRDRQPMADR